MYLPKPEPTKPDNGPSLTLAPGEEAASSTEESDPEESETSAKPEKAISLSAGQTSVAPMAQIDLTGSTPAARVRSSRCSGSRTARGPTSPPRRSR